jgi:hypothetical protein
MQGLLYAKTKRVEMCMDWWIFKSVVKGEAQMKCPICDGMGTSNTCVNGTFKPCSFCGGTGEVKDNLCETCNTICPFDDEHFECDNYTPLTNEGWLRTATTEQLAEFLIASIKKCKSCASGIGFDEVQHCPFGECGCHFKGEVVEWLKQPHTEKE